MRKLALTIRHCLERRPSFQAGSVRLLFLEIDQVFFLRSQFLDGGLQAFAQFQSEIRIGRQRFFSLKVLGQFFGPAPAPVVSEDGYQIGEEHPEVHESDAIFEETPDFTRLPRAESSNEIS